MKRPLIKAIWVLIVLILVLISIPTKQKTVESGNNLDKMQLFFDMQKNIVQEFIDSFNNLFMKIF